MSVWRWPAGGLRLAGEQVQVVVGEAGGAARLLGDEGEIAAETGHAAAIPRVWNHTNTHTHRRWGVAVEAHHFTEQSNQEEPLRRETKVSRN